MRTKTIAIAFVLSLLGSNLHGQPIEARSRVVSVGLFKNGLAVVRRSFTAAAPGTYEIADVPAPVHGTFWIESDAVVDTRITSREFEVEPDINDPQDFQRDLAGRKVTIRFREPSMPSLSGTVVKLADEKPRTWARNYPTLEHSNWYSQWGNPGWNLGGGNRHLIIESEGGRHYIDASMIAALSVADGASAVKRRKPVLEFEVRNMQAGPHTPATIEISYLAKGMSWAPSYRANIGDSKMLRLEQQAVIKNELGDIEDAEIFLISGYPSIEFAHVTSPLSPSTTLANFFTQLGQPGGLRHSSRGDVMTQNVVSYNDRGPDEAIDLSAMPEGQGIDLHYQSIGKRNLKEGDSLMVNVASGESDYERIVDWVIADDRDEWGRKIDEYRRQQEPEKFDESPYDAVRFRNPLKMPMTTAPTMIVAADRFYGQRMSYWIDVGEECTLRITKALSIRTRHVEYEEPGERQGVSMWGISFVQVPVKGEVTINNHRNETVTMVLRRRFSGQLVEADASPGSVLLEDGVYSANQRNELIWTIELKPGEERKLTYRYQVLTRH